MARGFGARSACLSILAVALAGCEGTISGPEGSTALADGGPGVGLGGGSGGTGVGAGAGGSASSGVLSAEFSRLTRAEYGATLRDALGVEPDLSGTPVDGRIGPFTSNASVSPDPVHPYLLAAEGIAAALIPSELPACDAGAVAKCISSTYQQPLERLYRRPLEPAELSVLAALIDGLEVKGLSATDATRSMLVTAILSPDFLFRSSPLASDATARARRLAEHVSYALWDAPPDPALRAAAENASADPADALASQALRLSADPRATPVLTRFIAQWFHVDTDLRLDNPEFGTSPRFLELVRFVEEALAGDLPVASLISSQRGFVHRDNLAAYGLTTFDGPSDADIVAVSWPASSARRGVLGQDLLADSTRHPDPSRRPIFRGLLVRRSLLCQSIPAPSPELIALAGEVGDRTVDARCSGCHLRMDPIGRAFARLDPGETGSAMAAEVLAHDELGGSYADLPALLDAVAGSRAFAECFAQHWLAFFLEQPLADADPAWVAELADAVEAGASLGTVIERTVKTLAARSPTSEPWCSNP